MGLDEPSLETLPRRASRKPRFEECARFEEAAVRGRLSPLQRRAPTLLPPRYHVIEGKKALDALNTDQKTLNGGPLTSYRKFRKNWLDYAIIGLKSEGPSKSSNWPADVA